MLNHEIEQKSAEEKFSDRLFKMRKNLKLTMKEAAAEIGVSVSTYRDWEYGRKVPACKVVAISKAFRVSIHQVLGVNEDPNQEALKAALYFIEDAKRMILNSLT